VGEGYAGVGTVVLLNVGMCMCVIVCGQRSYSACGVIV